MNKDFTTENENGIFHYKNYRPHKEDGPAILLKNGNYFWYFDGDYHRIGGPATSDGRTIEYWKYGKRHNLDGPAIIWVDGSRPPKYFRNYVELSETELRKLKKLKERIKLI